MLKKLLLISLMASLLGACGGNSIGPGAGEPDVTDVPDEEPTPTEPEVDCTPELTVYDFNSESEVEEWYVNDDGINIRLSHDPETQSALLVTPVEWTPDDPAHERQARVALDETKNLEGATVEFKLSLPESYLDDEGLVLQFVLQGSGYWDAGWITMDNFPRLSDYTEEELEDLEQLPTTEVNETTSIMLNYYTGEYLVTITGPASGVGDVSHVGMQLAQIPNDLTIKDPIALNRVTISEPATDCGGACEPEEILGYTFRTEEELADWSVNGTGDSLELALASSGGLAITPVYWDTEAEWHRQAILSRGEEGALDLRGATVTFTYDIPQAYIDDDTDADGLRLQFPITGASGNFYGSYIDADTLEATGNVTAITFEADDDSAAALSNFGLQLTRPPVDTDLKETIILRSVRITFPCEDDDGGPAPDPITLDFSEGIDGWSNDDWNEDVQGSTLSYDAAEEALVISPNWDGAGNERTAMYEFAGGEMPDLTGATVRFTLNVPDFYIDNPGMKYQFYSQQAGGSYAGSYGRDDIELSEAEPMGGGDYRFERAFTSDIREDITEAVRIGLKLQRGDLDIGGGAGEAVLLRKVEIVWE